MSLRLAAPAPTVLAALQPISSSHSAARRYSQARRNLLPRDEPVVAVSGWWAHEQVLSLGGTIETLLWCPPRPSGQGPPLVLDPVLSDLVERLIGTAQTSYSISPRTLARLHPGLQPPEPLSLVRLPSWDSAEVTGPRRLLLVADGIEYAGNLGTLVRTVDACGADGLVLTSPVARLTHPKVFTASRGTVLTTPVVEFPTVDEAWNALVASGFSVFVADPAAPCDYTDLAYPPGGTAVVVGSEGCGVAEGWRHPDATAVSIPMSGRADSLNVAVSAAILLFDASARLPR